MAAAEIVDPQLRSSVRAARANAVRCIKTIVVGENRGAEAVPSQQAPAPPVMGSDDHVNTLALGTVLHEDPSLPLGEEFERCMAQLIEEDKPCLLLFRSDWMENIEDSRWVLVAWIPAQAPGPERATYVGSRGLLANIISQPYFLREYFARSRTDLKWGLVKETIKQFRPLPPALTSIGAAGGSDCILPDGPINEGSTLAATLQRFAGKHDQCLRLSLIGSKTSVKWAASHSGRSGPDLLILDAKVHECKNVMNLAKSGLPSSVCFFALFSKEDLVFVHWCPDMGMRKDAARAMEEARYAVMKRVVLQVVLKALSTPPQRIIQIDAREPNDILEGLGRAMEGADASVTTPAPVSARGARPADQERGWPGLGAPADWPWDWPAAASEAAMPSTLAFPERHVPHWHGGSKQHSFQGEGGGLAGTGSSSRGRHKSVKFRD